MKKVIDSLYGFSDYGLSIYGNIVLNNSGYIILVISSLQLLQTRCYNLCDYFRSFCQTPIFKTPSLTQKEKFTCEIFGTQTTRNNTVCQKEKCSIGTRTCPPCINFSTKSRAEMKHHIAKTHSTATTRVLHLCKLFYKDFYSFYLLRNICGKNMEHTEIPEPKMTVLHNQ